MKAPIPLPVKSINVRHIAPGDWTADITFGIPNDGAHDDPTITLNSGEGVELPPNVGDIMLVRPPEIVGYANAKCSHLWGMTRGKLKPTKDMDEETDTQTTTDQPQRLATTLCSPSSFIAEVLRKDEAAVDELKTLVPEYTPPDEYAALHTRGKQALETLDEMTSLLRSAICICERQGTATNWEGFAASIRKLGLSGVTARTYRQANDELTHR